MAKSSTTNQTKKNNKDRQYVDVMVKNENNKRLVKNTQRQSMKRTDGLKKTDTYTTLKNEFEKKKQKNGSSGGHGF